MGWIVRTFDHQSLGGRFWLAGLFLLVISIAAFLFFKFRIQSRIFPSNSNVSPVETVFKPVIHFDFDQTVFFKEWKEHNLHGKTSFKIERDEHGEPFLRAVSRSASSIIFRKVDVKISERPFLSWEWKAIQFPSNKMNQVLAAKSDNDYAARVYVAFKGLTPFTSDTIQYVWDDHFPEGAHTSSPYSGRIKVLVIHHGPIDSASNGSWVFEKRDIIKDYEALYGKRPRANLIAIGFMSDSDNTRTVSEAHFRRLTVERSKPEPEPDRQWNLIAQARESVNWWFKKAQFWKRN